jgi:hypothetical protein
MSIVSSPKGLSLRTTLVASTQQVSCDVADEAVLLSMRDGEYYGLNEVAASIWKLVQTPTTVLAIRDALLAEYADISLEECEHAVLRFLSDMIALSLVEIV